MSDSVKNRSTLKPLIMRVEKHFSNRKIAWIYQEYIGGAGFVILCAENDHFGVIYLCRDIAVEIPFEITEMLTEFIKKVLLMLMFYMN